MVVNVFSYAGPSLSIKSVIYLVENHIFLIQIVHRLDNYLSSL